MSLYFVTIDQYVFISLHIRIIYISYTNINFTIWPGTEFLIILMGSSHDWLLNESIEGDPSIIISWSEVFDWNCPKCLVCPIIYDME